MIERIDRGGRLTEVREGSLAGRLLKQFVYGTANGGSNYTRGKLVTATRWHYVDTAIPPAAPNEETFSVVERYTYFGLGGRLSNRRTEGTMAGVPLLEPFDVGTVYEPTGRVQLTYYPLCGGCSLGVGYEQGLATGLALAFPLPTAPESVESWTEGFRFHPTGGLAEILRSNQTVDTFALDPTNPTRPQSFTTKLGPTTKWASGTYGFDGAGNVTAIGGSFFRYDAQSRLTLANIRTTPLGTDGGQQQRFVYDGFGNLQEIQGAQGLATPTSSATNRLSAPMAAYDNRGNLTGWGGAAYRWDPFNLMARMSNGSEDWIYLYTADDERVVSRKLGLLKVNRWTIRGLDNKVLSTFREEESNPGQTTWTTEARYFYHGSQLISAITQEGVRHHHLDHLGSPRLVTDAAGNQVAFHTYFPYGGEATTANQDGERMKFTGHERDLNSIAGTGDDLDYMHARFCSPVVGRFLSVDPVNSAKPERPQSWNRYSYSLGNPISYLDLDGRESIPANLLQFYQAVLGRDFSQVRIYGGLGPGILATALNARAATYSPVIIGRPKEVNDFHDSPGGIALIGHELTHVMQQGALGDFVGRNLAFNVFGVAMVASTALNGATGDQYAYENSVFEFVARGVEDAIIGFLQDNPEIAAKLQKGESLTRDELDKASNLLRDAEKKGVFGTGYVFVDGFLVRVEVKK